MEIDFEQLMSGKSDAELQVYLDEREKYTPEAIEAAITEMQKRGRIIPEDNLLNIRFELDQKRLLKDKEAAEFWKTENKWKKNVVNDETAPIYYSEKAIYGFSILFSVVFGAVLMANNLKKTDARKGVWEVVAFGVIYFSLQLWVLSMIPGGTGLTIATTMFGAIIMNQYFWKKYIGRNVKYRAKQIWKPLIIGLIIFIPLFLVVIYSNNF
jgi:hypothetical protein